MLKWIFFDIGNVILNDDPAMAVLYQEIYQAIREQGNEITFAQLLMDREQSISSGRNGRHFVSVAMKYLGRDLWSKYELRIKDLLRQNWTKLSPLMPEILPVIRTLAEKYNLGIIANQPSNVSDVLEKHGILRYFKVHGISQTVGLNKPDPEFFRWALREANCAPEESLMIGDRIDNDIKPARSVGMKTLWLPISVDSKGYAPMTELEKEYFISIRRASVSLLPPQDEDETPDGIARNFSEILEQVQKIDLGFNV